MTEKAKTQTESQAEGRKEIAVFGTNIRKDTEGRFSLNDLHKAAMAKGHATESQRPGSFLDSSSVQTFISALEAKDTTAPRSAVLLVVNGGRTPGSFACVEILFEYAKWLSAEICSELAKSIDIPVILIDHVRREFTFGAEIIQNLFKGYTIIEQFPVLGGKYRIDWYIPELHLAIEFDEAHHSTPNNQEADKARQQEIEKVLGCRFLRYTDK